LNRYDNAKVERIKFKGLKTSDAILDFEGKKYNNEIKKSVRIWPQDNDTEGFFVCKIRKK
jgi:16S rRNA C967 or C1407 C5-methylase (RsmB/RsmF family)